MLENRCVDIETFILHAKRRKPLYKRDKTPCLRLLPPLRDLTDAEGDARK